jgi:hypothetical protein
MKFALIVCILTLIILSVLGLILSLLLITNSEALSETYKNKFNCNSTGCPNIPIDITYKEVTPSFNNKNFNKKIASYCIQLINVIYYSDKKKYDYMKFTGLKHELTVNDFKTNKLDFGVIWRNETNKTIWITFRGTYNLKEWYNNFKISQTSYNDYNGVKTNLPSFIQEDKDNIKIHTGMLETYSNCSKVILDYLEKYKDEYNIILSGHSLGASIASIFSIELNYKGYKTVSYLYGCPRLGNERFCEKSKNIYRIENTADVIPTVPTSVSPNFLEPSKPYFYYHCGNLFSFTLNLKSLHNNHSLEAYNVYIKQLPD